MKRSGLSLLLLPALTRGAPLQTSTLVHANFDDLQPGTRLQSTPYASLTFSGLTIKDKGPRAIFPDTQPNYALHYHYPTQHIPLMSIAGRDASSFDFGGLAAGCLLDTTRSVAASRNFTTPPAPPSGTADDKILPTPGGNSPLSGTSLDDVHYPCVACTLEVACSGQLGAVRQRLNWTPGASWSSNVMARWTGFGDGFKRLSFCDVQVTAGAVDVEEIILVVDSFQYRVNRGQPQRAAVAVV